MSYDVVVKIPVVVINRVDAVAVANGFTRKGMVRFALERPLEYRVLLREYAESEAVQKEARTLREQLYAVTVGDLGPLPSDTELLALRGDYDAWNALIDKREDRLAEIEELLKNKSLDIKP